MNLGVSPLTNKIYGGKSKLLTNGKGRQWVGKKIDMTDEAIAAVFEWFMNNHKENEPSKAYEIRFNNCPYVLTMTREDN